MAKKPFKKTAKSSPVKAAQKKFAKKPEKKAYEQKPEHGALFKNEDKESDKHPDYKGTYTDGDGNKFWVAAWMNTSQAGKKYLSFITTLIDNEEEEEEEEEQDDDDELAF